MFLTANDKKTYSVIINEDYIIDNRQTIIYISNSGILTTLFHFLVHIARYLDVGRTLSTDTKNSVILYPSEMYPNNNRQTCGLGVDPNVQRGMAYRIGR